VSNKLERITLREEVPELKRERGEDVVKYLERMTTYMNRTIVGLDGKYEETLR